MCCVSGLPLSHMSWPVWDAHFRDGGGTLRVSSVSIRSHVLCSHSLQRHGIPPRGRSVWTEEPLAVDSLACRWGDGPQRPWASAQVNTTCTVTDRVVTHGAGAAQRRGRGVGPAPCDAGRQRPAWSRRGGRGGRSRAFQGALELRRQQHAAGCPSPWIVRLPLLPRGLCMPYQSILGKSEPQAGPTLQPLPSFGVGRQEWRAMHLSISRNS